MKIYLASPFFHQEEIATYDEVIRILRGDNWNVFVPREHTIPDGWNLPNHIWGESVFAVDYVAITQCDIVVVLNYGMYSDSGTAWECGAAYALGKTVVNVLCGGEDKDYSLMMVNGTHITVTLDEFRNTSFFNILEYAEKKSNTKILQK